MRHRAKPDTPTRLGDLETAIMRIVWQRGDVTVQNVTTALEPDRSPAYTTVMTVMSRLADKGLLDRRKDGRAYVYSPATAQEKLAGSMLSALVEGVYGGSASHAIAHLIETEDGVGQGELARLERLIQSKRKERQK